jgi:hypothetical protein
MSESQLKIPELLPVFDNKSNRKRGQHKSKAEKLESEFAKKKELLNEFAVHSHDCRSRSPNSMSNQLLAKAGFRLSVSEVSRKRTSE